jgi:hypothetical protein
MASEIETTVTFGKMPEFIAVWTNDPKWVRRILKIGVKPTQIGDRSATGDPDSYWFDVPAEKFVMRFRKGKRLPRTMPALPPEPSV